MRATALLVDFDGTLCDTESAAERSWAELYDDLDAGSVGDAWALARGRHDGHLVMAADLAARIGRGLREDEAARRRARKAELTGAAPACAGAGALLERAREAGLPVVVVSNSMGTRVHHDLRRIGLAPLVDEVVGGESGRPKPHPDLYLTALGVLGGARLRTRAVAVEDSATGVAAAQAAGLRCVGVGPAVVRAGADVVVAALDDIVLEDLVPEPASDGADWPEGGRP